jgi:hypothetical protein
MAYFRETVGLSTLNDPMKKLKSESRRRHYPRRATARKHYTEKNDDDYICKYISLLLFSAFLDTVEPC